MIGLLQSFFISNISNQREGLTTNLAHACCGFVQFFFIASEQSNFCTGTRKAFGTCRPNTRACACY